MSGTVFQMCILHQWAGYTINNATNRTRAGKDNLHGRAFIADTPATMVDVLQNRRSDVVRSLQAVADTVKIAAR